MTKKYKDAAMQDEYEEWMEYLPDILEAVEIGYFDDNLSELMQALIERRKATGAMVKIKRTALSTGSPVVSPSGASTTVQPLPGATFSKPGPVIPEPDYDATVYPHHAQSVANAATQSGWCVTANRAYTHHAIAKAGQLLYAGAHKWPLKKARKYRDSRFRLVKVNRSKCVVEVLEVDPALRNTTISVGDQVIVPIAWVVESMREYSDSVDTTIL